MIQEKDFLYRVPVKNVLITTPRQQVRNPEILVDLEGGEFMHGNILDANSTNKLINQSVKEAVENKIIESGYVTKDLLDAETSARTNGDEDLNTKIKAEQTRAEGKEKEISDKLAIVDGDSNTEGSFRKAIADVIAAAPEDLDTLKEIADKLAGNDDLHTALNQAITEKADASALANEVTRATSAESNLQAAIDSKQDAGNYIPYDSSVTSTYQTDKNIAVKINDEDTAVFGPTNCISLKNGDQNTLSLTYGGLHCNTVQNKIDIDPGSINQVTTGGYALSIDPTKIKQVANSYIFDVNSSDGIKLSILDGTVLSQISPSGLYAQASDTNYTMCNSSKFLDINTGGSQVVLNPIHLFATTNTSSFEINSITGAMQLLSGTSDNSTGLKLGYNGLRIGEKADINTDNGELISISRQHNTIPYIFKVKDNTIENNKCALNEYGLTNDKTSTSSERYTLYLTNSVMDGTILVENNANLSIGYSNSILTRPFWKFGSEGAEFNGSDGQKRIDIQTGSLQCANIFGIKLSTNVQQSSGTWDDPCQIQNNSDYVLFSKKIKVSDIITDATTDSSLNTVLSTKQDKIEVNSVDVTDIETNDIAKLRTIVKDLIDALSESGLIRKNINLE